MSKWIRLKKDIHSLKKEGHIHRAGEIGVGVKPYGVHGWIVQIRVGEDGESWYETLEVYNHEFEHVE